MWSRKPTVILGRTADDDWVVLRNGQQVGRIYPSPAIPHMQRLQWNTFTLPVDRGRADTLEQALHDMRAAIRARWPDSEPQVPLAAGKH